MGAEPLEFYERVEHTADLAIRVWGSDLPALFTHAAAALFDMMCDAPVQIVFSRNISIDAPDQEALLLDRLNQLIYLHEVEHESYCRFDITALRSDSLHAVVFGGPTTRKFKTIKATTFHELAIRQTADGYEAHIVFDV